MAVTNSWGYTNGTTSTTAIGKLPMLGASNYASDPVSSRMVPDREKTTRRVKVYTNLTSPTDQPERITLDVKRTGNFQLSFPTSFPASSPKGYTCTMRLEDVNRMTDEQGIQYDDGCFVEIKFGASDGTCRSGVLQNGVDWMSKIQRALAVLTCGVYDISDNQITVSESAQPIIDKMMHMVTDLTEPITQQA